MAKRISLLHSYSRYSGHDNLPWVLTLSSVLHEGHRTKHRPHCHFYASSSHLEKFLMKLIEPRLRHMITGWLVFPYAARALCRKCRVRTFKLRTGCIQWSQRYCPQHRYPSQHCGHLFNSSKWQRPRYAETKVTNATRVSFQSSLCLWNCSNSDLLNTALINQSKHSVVFYRK